MAKKSSNHIDTVLLQLASLCTTNENKSRLNDITEEYRFKDKVIKGGQQNKELYAILHMTRCLDSSLRLFLELYSILGSKHSMGDYLTTLTNHSGTTVGKLPENLRKRFQKVVVDERNKYMHSAGRFPNKSDVTEMENSISSCFQSVLNLVEA